MEKAPIWFGIVGVVLLGAGSIGWIVYDKLFRKEFPVFTSDSDHFKYGSIGNDGVNGLPYLVWRALPNIFPDLLPGPGEYASLGFFWEAGHSRDDAPVGISRARVGFERAAINCAFCHHTVTRIDAKASPVVSTIPVELRHRSALHARHTASRDREERPAFLCRSPALPVLGYSADAEGASRPKDSNGLDRESAKLGSRPHRSV
jgi:hypothetical protein